VEEGMKKQEMIEDLQRDEGFRGMPYECSEGHLTIGFGAKLPLSEREAEWLMENRLSAMMLQLSKTIPREAKDNIKDVRYYTIKQMVYQLGVEGTLGFKRMWAALERANYAVAAAEMLDSLWHQQDPDRCERLAEQMRTGVRVPSRR
jgi:lysozyme